MAMPEGRDVVSSTEDDRYRAAKSRVAQLRAFYTHLTTFIVVNLFLLAINLLTDRHSLWFYWVVLGWGIGLAAHAMQVYAGGTWFGRDWEERKIRELMDRNRPAPQ